MLLQTKFFAPAHNPKAVERRRLLERLDANSNRKLTLVIAPAGYGKTTVVSQWLHSRNHLFGWLSIDEADNEYRRFWHYVIASFERVLPGVGKEALNLLFGSEADHSEAVITALVNGLYEDTAEKSEPVFLVLDDFHHVNNMEILRQLVFFVDYLPPSVHLLITSRTEPLLPLSRWRVKNLLSELYATDLAFSDDECLQFFRESMSLDISEEEARKIRERTEGWVAAMQLAAISHENVHQNAGATPAITDYLGSDRLINDYVLSEILEQQPEEIQTFLLRSSCLVRLNSHLCDTVLEMNNSQEILAHLEQSNLFIIPLDTSHDWYRYHDLFRESLFYRIKQDNPEAVPDIQRKAIRWLLQHDQIHESIDQLVQLKDWAWLKEVLKDHGNTLIHEGHHLSMLKWLDLMPDELIEETPQLQMLRVWSFFFSNRIDPIPPLLDRLEDVLDKRVEQSHPDADGALALNSEISLIRSYLARAKADTQSAISLTKKVLEDIDHSNMPLKSMTYYGIGIDCFNKGELEEAEQALTSAIQYGKYERKPSAVISSSGLLTWLMYHRGLLDRAVEIYKETQAWMDSYLNDPSQPKMISCWQNSALTCVYLEKDEQTIAKSYLSPLLEHLESGTEPGQHIIIQYVQALLHYANENYQEAIHCIEDAQSVYELHRETVLYEPPSFQALKSKCQLHLGFSKLALAWAQANLTNPPQFTNVFNKFDHALTIAQILVATSRKNSNDLNKIHPLIFSLEAEIDPAVYIRHRIQLCLIKAQMAVLQGESDAAQAALDSALLLGQKSHHINSFREFADTLISFIQGSEQTTLSSTYQAELLRHLHVDPGKSRKKTPTRQKAASSTANNLPPLVDPLSQRELEVLSLINEGHANKEIASRLFLSPATVKAHIRNIYGKLGVKSRTEALAKARAHKLLEED